MTCSIWLSKDDVPEIIGDLLGYNEDDCLYEGHEIDELYIEKDGSLYGFISVGKIGMSINIPFDEWFQLFKKYKAFDELRQQIEKRILQQEVTLSELRNMFAFQCDSLSDTIIKEES